MKNLLITFLLLPLIAFSQTATEARQMADSMAKAASTPYQWFNTDTDAKTASFYYSRNDLTAQELQDQKDFGCEKCMIVHFKIKSGQYLFDKVLGTFEDLQPIWQSQFKADATPQLVKDDFKYRYVKNKDGTKTKIDKALGLWQISTIR